jgi:hypothetical protein
MEIWYGRKLIQHKMFCYENLKLSTVVFFFVLEQSKSGPGRVIVEVSRSHTDDRHRHTPGILL